jgi:TPR repeat protein
MTGIGGVPIDFQKAVFWNEKGAKGGDREGYNNLGWLYENGQGVARNVAYAASLYRRAAELGSEQAKERLLAIPAH